MDGGSDCSNDHVIMLGGAVVFSHPGYKAGERYPDNIECQLTFKAAAENWRLMMRIVDLDIPDRSESKLCNDALYVYNGESILAKPVVMSIFSILAKPVVMSHFL